MRLQKLHIVGKDKWAMVGYSSPCRKSSPTDTIYRFVRKRDGARVRIPSTKKYWCEVSMEHARVWFLVADGHDDTTVGGGARSLAADQKRAECIFALYAEVPGCYSKAP